MKWLMFSIVVVVIGVYFIAPHVAFALVFSTLFLVARKAYLNTLKEEIKNNVIALLMSLFFAVSYFYQFESMATKQELTWTSILMFYLNYCLFSFVINIIFPLLNRVYRKVLSKFKLTK